MQLRKQFFEQLGAVALDQSESVVVHGGRAGTGERTASAGVWPGPEFIRAHLDEVT